MTSSPDPIRAQLIAARRNQILDAATKVFAEKAFYPTTIKDIASEAGITDLTEDYISRRHGAQCVLGHGRSCYVRAPDPHR